jgi:hypothetical protein
MRADRRNFLLDTPAALLGLGGFAEIALAQAARGGVKTAPEVVDFWVSRMGLSPESVVGGVGRTRGRRPNGPVTDDLAREPLFLHYDQDAGELMTADEVPAKELAPTGDTAIQFQLVRMRLNDADDRQFRSYTSGGIYVDFQQSAAPASSGGFMDTLAGIGSSLFAAIGSESGKGKSGGGAGSSGSSSGKSKSGGGSAASKGNNFFQSGKAPAAANGTSVPLQAASQAQSITLPGGSGKHSFACFAKDRQKTLFGTFVGVFATLLNSPLTSYLPMLSMPVIGPPALNAMRSLVANLQSHGGEQQWIMMSPPVDVVTTQDGAKNNPSALRFRPGNYIMIPKEHSDAIKGQLSNLKILDGFLVPKEAKPLDVYDTYATAAPGVSYISVNLGVQPAKAAGGRSIPN